MDPQRIASAHRLIASRWLLELSRPELVERRSCANHCRQTKFSFWILRRRFHFAHCCPDLRCAAGIFQFRLPAERKSEVAHRRTGRRRSLCRSNERRRLRAQDRVARISRFVCACLADSARVSSISIRHVTTYAATALRACHRSTAIVDCFS